MIYSFLSLYWEVRFRRSNFERVEDSGVTTKGVTFGGYTGPRFQIWTRIGVHCQALVPEMASEGENEVKMRWICDWPNLVWYLGTLLIMCGPWCGT